MAMGFWLHVELDCKKELLPDLARWTSKAMMYALCHGHKLFDGSPSILDLVAEKLDIDVRPLHKVTGGDTNMFFEGVNPNDVERRAHAERQRLEYLRRCEASWQSPSVLRTCIQTLTQALDSHPQVFIELEVSQYHDGDYYLSGDFRRDLDCLGQIAEWAESNNVPRLRLVWA